MKKHIVLSMLCGICAALALPPFFYLPLAIIGFSGLYLLLAKAKNFKQSFWLGWSFGFGHHVVGLYWISNALLTDPARFGWMIPFAISLIPAALAIYIGLVAVAHKRFVGTNMFSGFGVVLFATLWVIGEWLRAHLFTGFPWNLIGYAFNIHASTMQAASIFGIYGLSFIFVLATTAPILLVPLRRMPGYKKSGELISDLRRNNIISVSVCSVVFPLILIGFGIIRLQGADLGNTTTKIHIVQPNLSLNHKWDEMKMLDGLFLHLKL